MDKKGRVRPWKSGVQHCHREPRPRRQNPPDSRHIQVGKRLGNQPLDDAHHGASAHAAHLARGGFEKSLDKKKFKTFLANPPEKMKCNLRRPELDYILTTMLDSQPEVSDLLFTVAKPLQVESFGELRPVAIDPPIEKLTPYQTEAIALNLIGERPVA